MLLRALALFICVSATMACSSLRKISNVETRELASLRTEEAISPLRDKVSRIQQFARACPQEVVELLPVLANERVAFPLFRAKLAEAFGAAKEVLRGEERSMVEELLAGQCRTLPNDFASSALDSLIEGVVPRVVAGQVHEESSEPVLDAHLLLRMRLRDELLEVRAIHEPMEQWIRIHGEFVMPEEELLFFERLVGTEKCRLSDQEVGQSYRTLHSLEALARMHGEQDPQRKRVKRFLFGVNKMIDRKIREYFTR